MKIFKYLAVLIVLVIAYNKNYALASPDNEQQMRKLLCTRLDINHTPDKGIHYMPSTDPSIRPADVSNAINFSEVFPVIVPIEIDLIKRFNLKIPEDILDNAEIAELAITRNGDILLNRHDISSTVVSFCGPEFKSVNDHEKSQEKMYELNNDILKGEHH